MNRVTQIRDTANASPVTYGYDALYGDSLTDPGGNLYTTSFNALGLPVVQRHPYGGSDSIQYDVEGLVRRTVNRRQQAVVFTYDAGHRLLTRTGSAIVSDTTSYSSDGRVTTATNANSVVTTYVNSNWRDLDSVQTVLRIPGLGSQTYTHRYLYRSNGLLDSTARRARAAWCSLAESSATTNGWGSIASGSVEPSHVSPGTNDQLPTKVRLPGADSIVTTYTTDHSRATLRSRLINDDHYFDNHGRIQQQRDASGYIADYFGYDENGVFTGKSFGFQVTCSWDPGLR